MEMEIYKEFTFEAAHDLPSAPPGHKCRRLHGHSYRVRVHVVGEIDPERGWVEDFGVISDAIRPVIDILDHRYLNDIDGLANPTSEMIAIFLWERLAPLLSGLSGIRVNETCTTGCDYRGPPPGDIRRGAASWRI